MILYNAAAGIKSELLDENLRNEVLGLSAFKVCQFSNNVFQQWIQVCGSLMCCSRSLYCLSSSGTCHNHHFLFTSYSMKETSEGILFQLRNDVNTHHYKSTYINVLSCLIWLSDKRADSMIWLVGSPVNQAPCEGSITLFYFLFSGGKGLPYYSVTWSFRNHS